MAGLDVREVIGRYGTAIAGLVLVVFFLLFAPNFASTMNIINVLKDTSFLAILALGFALAFTVAELDLSIAEMASLAAVVCGWMVHSQYPPAVAFGAALAVGIVLGSLNGYGVTVLRIPSLIMTLGTAAIAKGLAAVLFRMTRAAMLDALANDYVRTARAKGLSPTRVIVVHVLRNALNPVVTVLGLQMGTLLGGTVLVEYVFNWPGMSTPLLRAVEGRDYPMVVGIVLTISVLFLLLNLVVELVHALLDPRVAHS